jgi:hypothetical protein
MDNLIISESTKKEILSNLVEPSYKNEIKTTIRLKKLFKSCAICFETTSKFFVGVSSIMSFASGIYKIQILTFLAGTTSVISLVLLQYASFSYRESKKMGSETDTLLKKVNFSETNYSETNSNPASNLDSSIELNNLEPNTPKI